MLLLVGLGNPGDKYAKHRHNVGFMAVDGIADRHHFAPARKKFQGLIRGGDIGTRKCLVLKPQTFMNDSGRSVGEAMRYHKLSLDEVIVFYDELDLPPGKMRMKIGGGAAGHNGIRSITRHIGADFRRCRIGIGHPGDKSRVHKHVLSDFAKSENPWLGPMLAAIAENADALADGDSQFMNRVHLALGATQKTGA